MSCGIHRALNASAKRHRTWTEPYHLRGSLRSKYAMRCHAILLFAGIFLVPGTLAAFERDVHFGLTKWLALKAEFTPQEAEALATGDQRVDSGDMPFIELVTAYACLAKDKESSTLVERHHYPPPGRVPG